MGEHDGLVEVRREPPDLPTKRDRGGVGRELAGLLVDVGIGILGGRGGDRGVANERGHAHRSLRGGCPNGPRLGAGQQDRLEDVVVSMKFIESVRVKLQDEKNEKSRHDLARFDPDVMAEQGYSEQDGMMMR